MSASLWHGILGVLGTGREIGWIAVVEPHKAYIDESDIHDNAQWCFVAGHLGTEEQWKEFDGKWREGLGNRKSLHMKELRWNSKPERIERLLGRLGPIPDSCKLERIFGSVKGSHYLDVLTQYPELQRNFDPYMLALYPCVMQTLRHLPRSERVLFTFEENLKYSDSFPRIQSSLAKEPDFVTPSGEPRAIFVTVPKGATPRTEAADYLAFEMGQFQKDKDSFKAQAGVSILGDHWMIGKQMPRADIRGVCEKTLAMGRVREARINSDIKELIRLSKMGRP